MKKLAAALLLSLVFLGSQFPSAVSASGCSQPTTPFIVTNVVWGSPDSPIQVQPGDSGVPLTVSLLYVGCDTILYSSFSLPLPQGFTPADPQAGSTVYLQEIHPYSVSDVAFDLNLAPSPQLNVGNWFSSTMTISFTLDGVLYTDFSLGVADQVLGRASLTFAASPQSLVAGQLNDLTLTIQNNGTGAASQVSTSVTSASGLSILGTVPEVNLVAASSAYTRSLPVYVPSTLAGDALSLVVSSTYVDPYSNARTATQTVSLFSPSGPETVDLGIVPSANELTSGEVSNVTFTLANSGSGAAKNLTISVAQSQTLSVIGLPPKVDSLLPSSQSSFPLELYASSAAAGSALSLTFTVTYQDPYGISKVFTQSVGFYSPSLNQVGGSPLSVQVKPDVLTAGKINNLTITLGNVGNTTLSGLTVAFSSPSGAFTWLNPNQAQVTSLAPGSNFTVQGSLFDPSQAAASTTLQLSVTYYRGTVQTQETRSIGLLTRGEIDLSLTSLAVLPQTASPGDIVSMTLTLTNLGVISASGVTASFGFPQGFRAVGSSTSFIGDMAVDSPSTITVSALVVNSTTAGNYKVPVTLSYFDNLRTQLSQTLNVTVVVSSAAQNATVSGQRTGGFQTAVGGRLGLVLDVVIVAIIAVIAYLVVRRLRRPKPAA